LIGGARSAQNQATLEAFAVGARLVNPKVKTKIAFVGDSKNAPKAQSLANRNRKRRRRFVSRRRRSGCRNAAGSAEHQGKRQNGVGVWFGAQPEQSGARVTLGSATIELAEAFDQIEQSVRESKFQAGVMPLQISEETIAVEWNEANRTRISSAAWDKIDGAMELLKKGELKVSASSK
jgi:basic membrane lipoprotein Med (substrate-binding protein (PBP1-ABC) superfamily)